MNVPSAPARAEIAPLDRAMSDASACLPAQPSAQIQTATALRRWPLPAVGSWRWLLGQQRTAAGRPAAKRPRPVLAVSRLRRMRRCGRTAVVWGVIWYALAMVVPLLLEHRWQRTGPAHEWRKWPALRQLVSKCPERPLLLMLGSSRGCWAFRAGCLDGMPDSDGRPLSVFNFGVSASGPISELFYLQDMLAEGIRPRFVVIEIIPPLLGEAQRGALTEEGLLAVENLSTHRFLQWLPYLHRKEKRTYLWLESRLLPWYAFRYHLRLELKCLANGRPFPTIEPLDDWGWHLPTTVLFPDAIRQIRLKIAYGGYSPGLNHFRLGKKPVQALHELLNLCRREKIPAALVLMPESSEFRSWYSEDAKTALHGLLDELHQTYGVPLIDGRTWVADDDFEDGHHTLRHGADVFTSRLQAELVPLLAQSAAVKSD